MRINSNPVATTAVGLVNQRELELGKSLEKLSSGFRINRAGDDAAGLVISQKLRYEISGLKTGLRNAQDGISVVSVIDGAVGSWSDQFTRMRDLVLQYLNDGSVDDDGKSAIRQELTGLVAAFQLTAANAKFGEKALLGLSPYVGVFQVGNTADDTITVSTDPSIDLDASIAIGTAVSIDYLNDTIDASTLQSITDAANGANRIRARMGALSNRFERAIANLQTQVENLTNSESRIRDTDMASEMVNFTRHQILVHAATAMVAQANQLPQTTLRLFG